MPGLLVSVKDRTEAATTFRADVDILDIKAPNNGPLGMATTETIRDILETCGNPQTTLISAALGELEQWPDSRAIPPLLNRLDYLKVGPGQCETLNDWLNKLVHLKTRFQQAGIVHPRWIAVLYADRKPATELDHAHQFQLENLATHLKGHLFAGLLIDTASKQGGSLRTCFSDELLKSLAMVMQRNQLLCSFAGRLTFQDIEALIEQSILPDYYAVRSAVCTDQNRRANIEYSKVLTLMQILRSNSNRPRRCIGQPNTSDPSSALR